MKKIIDFINLQKKIFLQNRKLIIKSSLFPKDFLKYEILYKKNLSDYEELSDFNSIKKEIKKNNIIFFGDYITLKSPKKIFLKFIKEKEYENKNIAILQSKMYDFKENYAPIFEFANNKNIPIYEIDDNYQELIKNANSKTKLINKLITKYDKIFVLVSDIYLSRGLLASNFPHAVIIHENPDDIFYKLVEKKINMPCFVKIRNNQYAYLETNPIYKQQSYLNWSEKIGSNISEEKITQEFNNLLIKLLNFIKIKKSRLFNNLKIYSYNSFDFLEILNKSNAFNMHEIDAIKKQISSQESIYLPKIDAIFLSNLSIDHVSEEMSHFVKYILSGKKEKNFSYNDLVINEAIGFLGSKIVNPQRKCDRHPVKSEGTWEAAHTLGYQMGEKIFNLYRKKKITRQKLKKLFL
jgi:hypothetical protein